MPSVEATEHHAYADSSTNDASCVRALRDVPSTPVHGLCSGLLFGRPLISLYQKIALLFHEASRASLRADRPWLGQQEASGFPLKQLELGGASTLGLSRARI